MQLVKIYFSILLLVVIIGGAALAGDCRAQTVITDYMSMEGGMEASSGNFIGNVGDVVTPGIATASTTGTSGVWSNSNSVPSCPAVDSTGCTLTVSSAKVRPPRGEIKIDNTTLPNISTKSFKKLVTNATDKEYVDYVLNSPRSKKVSVGMFLMFADDGSASLLVSVAQCV